MAADKQKPGSEKVQGRRVRHEREQPRPEWAEGLRALYDSVVHEPLPDNFKDLLEKLDDPSPNGPA